MSTPHDFLRWTHQQAPHLRRELTDLYGTWLQSLDDAAECCSPEGEYTVDSYYTIVRESHRFSLYTADAPHPLTKLRRAMLAAYSNPAHLIADLIAHSVRRTGTVSLNAYLSESERLTTQCQAVFQDMMQWRPARR
ncbi:Uncharacterised protein [Serratia quinivorans]|uniref:DUF5405 family protein n=1 Tax=Serratia quinivorans TaxID=137545 RepID=UPI00217BFC61|nr:DUF5405 family protein [Serratia quinivorans]CAI1636569.1 Uncharacterised protein [Serratia quinivorans]